MCCSGPAALISATPSWSRCNKREPGSGCAALDGVNRKHAVLGTSPNCIATYAGDFAPSLIALDAAVEIAGPAGARRMRFRRSACGAGDDPARETVLQPGELITGFHRPRAALRPPLALSEDPRPPVL